MYEELLHLAKESYQEINQGMADHDPNKRKFLDRRTALVTFVQGGVNLSEEQRVKGLQILMEDFRRYMENITHN